MKNNFHLCYWKQWINLMVILYMVKLLDRQSILIHKYESRIIQQTHQTQFSIAEVKIPEKDYIFILWHVRSSSHNKIYKYNIKSNVSPGQLSQRVTSPKNCHFSDKRYFGFNLINSAHFHIFFWNSFKWTWHVMLSLIVMSNKSTIEMPLYHNYMQTKNIIGLSLQIGEIFHSIQKIIDLCIRALYSSIPIFLCII